MHFQAYPFRHLIIFFSICVHPPTNNRTLIALSYPLSLSLCNCTCTTTTICFASLLALYVHHGWFHSPRNPSPFLTTLLSCIIVIVLSIEQTHLSWPLRHPHPLDCDRIQCTLTVTVRRADLSPRLPLTVDQTCVPVTNFQATVPRHEVSSICPSSPSAPRVPPVGCLLFSSLTPIQRPST